MIACRMGFIKFSLAHLFYLTLIVGVYSQYSCDVLLPNANVYCISPTQFTVEPPSLCEANTTVYSCPDGLICTDVNTICTTAGPAACKLSKACSRCPLNALGTCINSKQYVNCENGVLDTAIKYCPASRPYCSMEYNSDGNIGVVCTNTTTSIACRDGCNPGPLPTKPPVTEPPPTEPTVTVPPPTNQCCKTGNFKVTVDVSSENKCGVNHCPDDGKEIDLNISISLRAKRSN